MGVGVVFSPLHIHYVGSYACASDGMLSFVYQLLSMLYMLCVVDMSFLPTIGVVDILLYGSVCDIS
jgi:hypothetical protein